MAAYGESFPLKGTAFFIPHCCYVAHIPYQALLGADFLSDNKACIDYDSRTFQCADSAPVQLETSFSAYHPRVYATTTITIPAFSQITLQASIQNSPAEGTLGMVTPNHWLGPNINLICANSIAFNRSASCPVMLLNPSTADVVLHKGTTLGYFQQLDSKTEYIDLGPAHDNAASRDGCAPNLATPCADASPQVGQTQPMPMPSDPSDGPHHCNSPDTLAAAVHSTAVGPEFPVDRSATCDIQDVPIYTDPPDFDLSSSDATESQKANLRELFQAYRHVFANSDSELGLAKVPPHEIDVGDARPIKSMPYKVSPERRKLIVE